MESPNTFLAARKHANSKSTFIDIGKLVMNEAIREKNETYVLVFLFGSKLNAIESGKLLTMTKIV